MQSFPSIGRYWCFPKFLFLGVSAILCFGANFAVCNYFGSQFVYYRKEVVAKNLFDVFLCGSVRTVMFGSYDLQLLVLVSYVCLEMFAVPELGSRKM